MNDEKKYTVIPFLTFLTIYNCQKVKKNVKSINKKCTIFNTFKVQNYFSLQDETPLDLQVNVIFLKVLMIRAKPILVKQRHLATRVREHLSGNSAIF